MSYPKGYARGTRTRAVLATVLAGVLWVYDAADALVSAIVGVPSVTRWALARTRLVYLGVRRVYLSARYGRTSGCTQVRPHVVDAEIVDEGAGR